MKEKFEQSFKQKLEKIDLKLSAKQIDDFFKYYELLIEWNKVMNLTAITDMEEVIVKHFIDSLALVQGKRLSDEKLIDIGTGAGFPGIPLKIAFPQLKVTLLDSLNKRIKFLDTVIETLGLSDISAIHGRAEDFGRDHAYRECYDIAVSRAVANLSTLSEYCLPYVKVTGYFIPYKSGNIKDELDAAKRTVKLLSSKVEDVIEFNLIDTDIERSFVMIKKVSSMSKRYPRKAGLPAKEPLG